ncbi:hypothetical protein ACLK15_04070 [Escherichia coli]
MIPFAAGKGISFRKLLIFPFSLIAVIFSWPGFLYAVSIHQRENNEGAKDARFAVGNVMCAITSPFYWFPRGTSPGGAITGPMIAGIIFSMRGITLNFPAPLFSPPRPFLAA